MEYSTRLLEIEAELESLKVDNPKYMKYMDVEKRLRKLEDMYDRVLDTKLRDDDKFYILEKIEGYISNINTFSSSANLKERKRRNTMSILLNGIVGVVGYIIGYKKRDFDNDEGIDDYKARDIAGRIIEKMYEEIGDEK